MVASFVKIAVKARLYVNCCPVGTFGPVSVQVTFIICEFSEIQRREGSACMGVNNVAVARMPF
jgi:hypothetical protein